MKIFTDILNQQIAYVFTKLMTCFGSWIYLNVTPVHLRFWACVTLQSMLWEEISVDHIFINSYVQGLWCWSWNEVISQRAYYYFLILFYWVSFLPMFQSLLLTWQWSCKLVHFMYIARLSLFYVQCFWCLGIWFHHLSSLVEDVWLTCYKSVNIS